MAKRNSDPLILDGYTVVPKREVMKLQAGSVIKLAWLDTKPTVAILLDKPCREKGDVSLHCMHFFVDEDGHFSSTDTDSHAVHSQVVCIRSKTPDFLAGLLLRPRRLVS